MVTIQCYYNFHLASKIFLKNLQGLKEEFQNVVLNDMMKYQTKQNFILPSAPHFRGIWEAGVKPVKGHVARMLGNTLLAFGETAYRLMHV